MTIPHKGEEQVGAVKIDPRAEAERRLRLARGERTGIDLELASVYASLAITEQLERLADRLESAINVSGNS